MNVSVIVLCSLLLAVAIPRASLALDEANRKVSKKSTKAYDLPLGKLYVDPNAWSKSTDNNVPGAALELVHKEGDAFLAVVTSDQFVPANDFIDAFVSGMTAEGTDVRDSRLTNRQMVNVNGRQLTDITITAEVSKQMFVYRGYLYTGTKGVCFVLAWTHIDLYRELTSDIVGALNGFIIK